MSSTLHGHKTPRGQKAPDLEQALAETKFVLIKKQMVPSPCLFSCGPAQTHAVERGVWDSKHGITITAEVSRTAGIPWGLSRGL